MRDFLVNGTRILTDDAIADAVVDLSRELSNRGRVEVVTFPGIVEGALATTWMSVGAGVPLLMIQADTGLPVSIAGSELAVWAIRRRRQEIEQASSGDDR